MRRTLLMAAVSVAISLAIGLDGQARLDLPGIVPPSGCFTSGVMSTDQFTSTGFSQSRTVGPNATAPAGAWVIEDDSVTSTGVLGTTNCPPSGVDGVGTYVVGLQVTPTIVSWQEADIEQLKLVQDTNLNGLYEPGLDPVLQIRSGSELASSGGSTFFFGPQSAIFTVPSRGAIGIMAIVEIGANPVSGSRFGLSLEAQSADVPTFGTISSGFASSRNPAGSSLRLQIVGGQGNGDGPTPPGDGDGGSIAEELRSYDTDPSNGRIDDPEFFAVIDDWAAERIGDDVFFAALDLWVQGAPIASAATSTEPQVRAQRTPRGVRFAAPQAQSLTVRVFGLDGRRVYRGTSAGSALVWPLRTDAGQAVANGVYLYRASFTMPNGEVVQYGPRKLVTQR